MLSDPALPLPPDWLIRAAVGAVWLYEGLWCKLLGRAPTQLQVVEAVPFFASRTAARRIRALRVAGYLVIRVSDEELSRRPERAVASVSSALAGTPPARR